VVVATSLFLLMASGCTKQDPYAPPDLFYYFASYKVGKNPTTVTPADVNQDGFTDLVTTNIGSNYPFDSLRQRWTALFAIKSN